MADPLEGKLAVLTRLLELTREVKVDVVLSDDLRKVWLNGRRMKRVGNRATSCRKIFGGQGVIVKLNDCDALFQNMREVKILKKWAGTKYAKHMPALLDYSLHYTWIAVKRIYPLRVKTSRNESILAHRIAYAIGVGDINYNHARGHSGANWGIHKGEVMLLDLGYEGSSEDYLS